MSIQFTLSEWQNFCKTFGIDDKIDSFIDDKNQSNMDIGQMKCLTIFSSRSYSGFKLDVLKSGLQKYGRRRQLKKMVRCVLEMNLFKLFGKKAQGIRTNMINRLKVMCFEELCFCRPDDFLRIMDKIYEWDENERQDDKLLVDICEIFVTSELLRLPSDIKNYYRNVFPKLVSPDICEPDLSLIEPYKTKDDDDEKVLTDLAYFIDRMEHKNDEVFYYMFNIMRRAQQGIKGGRRWRRRDCDYIIWEVLFDKAKDNPMLKRCLDYALKEYFKKNRTLKGDRLVVIVTAVLWVLHRDKLDWEMIGRKGLTEAERVELMDMSQPFVPDAFIIDKHCAQGRAAGKNIVDFAKEGSLVVGENKEWLNQTYRDAYTRGKVSFKKKKKKEDVLEASLQTIDIQDLTPAMQRTCGNKAMCFFGKYQGKAICLKEGRKSMNYNRDYIVVDSLKKLFGLRDLNMKRIKMDKVSRKKDKKLDTWDNNTEWVKASGTVYCMMDRIEGATRLSWKKEKINMKVLVKMGLYRGIFQVTDFNLCNVLVNEAGELWSIDEHQIGKRKRMFDKKGWTKQITKEVVDEVLIDIMEYAEIKWEKIRDKLRHYKFSEVIISLCCDNYKNLKERVYAELGY